MTEIPEHLLKRSKERRSALGLGGGESDSAPEGGAATPTTPATTGAASSSTPAATPSGPPARKAAAEPAAPPPAKPDPPYVAAAKSRPKIPVWAMAALSLMPIWMFMYVRSLTAPPEVLAGPMGVGAEVYGNCSSCHGANGEGGTGRAFSDGEVNLTFPHIEDQLRFVYFGTDGYNLEGVSNYGDPDREGGAHTTGSFGVMPQQGALAGGTLTDDEILGVVCHERYSFNGPDPTDEEWVEEYETWCAEESPVFAAVEAGTALADLDTAGLVDIDGNAIEIIDIGDAPAEGSPAD